jgi:hypothetical protein
MEISRSDLCSRGVVFEKAEEWDEVCLASVQADLYLRPELVGSESHPRDQRSRSRAGITAMNATRSDEFFDPSPASTCIIISLSPPLFSFFLLARFRARASVARHETGLGHVSLVATSSSQGLHVCARVETSASTQRRARSGFSKRLWRVAMKIRMMPEGCSGNMVYRKYCALRAAVAMIGRVER